MTRCPVVCKSESSFDSLTVEITTKLKETPNTNPNPAMSLNPTSSPTDLNPAKKSKPNSPELPEYELPECQIDADVLKLSPEERMRRSWLAFGEELKKNPPPKGVLPDGPKFDPSQPLPKGYAWSSYIPGSGIKSFPVRMHCIGCGLAGDHWTDDCPKKGTEEFKRNFTSIVENYLDETGKKTK
ncbi:uncharacterized protein LOC133718439 [Rosa rugosa]|uniref:uncharacterized protein LOC133718439 n=1 Tax=Rosa rugosa TaxID=74645 RepID=UPI002B410B7C|nr:uncharacterized protein LOC133718439 [Rosa rugosa]